MPGAAVTIRHTLRYVIQLNGVATPEAVEVDADRLAAIDRALRTLRELSLLEVEAACADWRRVVRPGCFWAGGTGIVIAKIGSSPKRKDAVVRFLGSCPGVRETDWCYHFTTRDGAAPDEATQYIDDRIRPALDQYFERARVFVFHCRDCPVEIPPWLEAEFCTGPRVLVFYGLARPGAGHSPPPQPRSGDSL